MLKAGISHFVAITAALVAVAVPPSVTAQIPASATTTIAPGHIPPPSTTPVGAVQVGIYLYSIQEIDFARHTFHPRFEIWWRWRGDGFDPLATLHIVGARSASAVQEDRRKLADGENYLVARVDAVINQTLDTVSFPFDRHRLQIQIESPYEDEYLQYTIDNEASLLDPDSFSPGWRLTGFRMSETRIKYPTTFGLKERVDERYSRVVAEVVAERVDWRVAVDYFVGFIVCVLVCLLAFFIHPRLIQVRASLVTAATITAVGNKYIVNSLTETSVTARLANAAVITSFAMVLLLMISSIVCERMIEAGQTGRALRLNRKIGITAAIVYVLVMAFFFLEALTGAPT
jgi:hypothetical protein